VDNYGTTKSQPLDRFSAGPFDITELIQVRPSIDFGAIQLPMRDDVVYKLEVEEATNRIVALTVEHRGSTLQLQAFSAPGAEGVWHEIRSALEQSITAQGGKTESVVGPLGPELNAQIATRDGTSRLAKFIGVDGPKWFLRGVISGLALGDTLSMSHMIDIFRSVAVVRGSAPMPPKGTFRTCCSSGRPKECELMSDDKVRASAAKRLGISSTDGTLSLDGKSLLEGMGGKLGITETILPSLLFGASFALTGEAIIAVSLAGGTSALFILYRLITRKSASSALIGAIAVGFAAWLALREGGEAVDYFVPGFITNAVYGSVLLISILVRWPIIGVLVEILRGNATSWRKDRKKLTIYSLVTSMWVGFFSLRLAVQVPLFLAGSVELLATARVAMGPPLYALVILVTWLILRATVLRTR
jgi:hypothetical protein